MEFKKSLYGSALVATLLFTGCNTTDGGDDTTGTPAVTTEQEVNSGSEQTAPIGVTNAEKLSVVANNMKVEIAKIEAGKSLQAANNAKIHVADIVHTLVNYKSGKSFKSNGAHNSFLEAIKNGEIVLTVEEQAELDAMTIESFNAEYFRAFAEAVVGNQDKQTQGLLTPLTDKLKDLLVDVAGSDLLDGTVNKVFIAALNSEGVTTAMLDMAIGSETITQIMIDAMIYDWAGLTPKMIPMLETNKEFGEKFAVLAQTWDIMGHYFFEAVDAPMYAAVTKAMILSPETTTRIMSEMMITYATEYFVIPGTDYVPAAAGVAGDKERFVSILFDTGVISATTGENADSTTRGDGNELANEEFFYAMFKTPETTKNFVTAMQAVKAENPATVKTLMDHIFLGERVTADGIVVDREQGIYNIYAIAKGMGEGLGGNGFDSYSGSFTGFAGLVAFDRYVPYAKSFIGAASHYMDENGYSVSEFLSLAREAIFVTEEVDAPVEVTEVEDANKTTQSKRLHAEGDEEAVAEDQAWYDGLWDSVVDFFGEGFDSISEWWDGQTGQFDEYIDEIKTTIGETVDGLTEEARVYVEGELQALLGDADYVLPPFSEINIDYVTGEAERRFNDYITVKGYDGALSDLSETEFVQEYVYGTLLAGAQDSEYWEYMPNWIAGMDWLKVPDTYEDYKLEFNADNIAVYIISKNDSLESMRDILGKPDLIQVDTLEDSPISNESGEFYIYKLIVLNGDDIDFGALAEAGEDASDYVSSIVVDNSEASSEPEATETTN
jgi:hypothetical protein